MSDTHGDINNAIAVMERISADLVIHLGDVVSDVKRLIELYPAVKFEFVAGNNDFMGEISKTLTIEGFTFFITHGHTYGVSRDASYLAEAAMQKGAAIALFGHIHRPFDETVNGVRCLCPGSPSIPRNSDPSCLIIEIEDGNFKTMFYDYL